MQKRCMIITLGTGKGVEHGIAKSIVVNRPDKIIFLVSKETLENNMPQKIDDIVQQEFGSSLPEYHHKLIDEPEKVEKVYQVTYEAIRFALQHNIAREDIYLDFTSGTKAMSVGAALAAYLNRCRTMVYTGGGQRDTNTGRVISGTEIVTIFTLRDVAENYRPDVAMDDAFQQKPREINL